MDRNTNDSPDKSYTYYIASDDGSPTVATVYLAASPSQGSGTYAINSKIMIIAVVVLFVVVMFILALHIYAKWFWKHGAGSRYDAERARRARRRLEDVEESEGSSNPHAIGLDKSVIDSLPTFVHSQPKGSKETVDCAVCLEEFLDGEKGRLLPKCNHSFHTECIDEWFNSHATCPLCRCNVVPDPPAAPSEATAVLIEGPNAVIASPAGIQERGVSTAEHEQLHEASGLRTNNRTDSPAVPEEEASVEGSAVLRQSARAKAPGCVRFPANVLFWGNQSQLNVNSNALQVGENSQQAGQGRPSYLVVEIPHAHPENAASNFSSIPHQDEASSQGPKSPIGRLMTSSFRRFLSLRQRQSSSDCDNCECEQQGVAAVTGVLLPDGTAQRQV